MYNELVDVVTLCSTIAPFLDFGKTDKWVQTFVHKHTICKCSYNKALFYALIVFLKKWL